MTDDEIEKFVDEHIEKEITSKGLVVATSKISNKIVRFNDPECYVKYIEEILIKTDLDIMTYNKGSIAEIYNSRNTIYHEGDWFKDELYSPVKLVEYSKLFNHMGTQFNFNLKLLDLESEDTNAYIKKGMRDYVSKDTMQTFKDFYND